MRTRPSGVDQDIPLFEFAFGKVELELLSAVLLTALSNMPNTFMFKPHRARLQNIVKGINNTLTEYERQGCKK